jgi:hypothetical protein
VQTENDRGFFDNISGQGQPSFAETATWRQAGRRFFIQLTSLLIFKGVREYFAFDFLPAHSKHICKSPGKADPPAKALQNRLPARNEMKAGSPARRLQF